MYVHRVRLQAERSKRRIFYLVFLRVGGYQKRKSVACLSKHLLYMRFFISDRKSGKQKLRVDTKTTKTNKESKCQSNKKMAQRMSGTGSNGKADVT